MAYQSSISEAEPAAAGERGRSAADLLRQLLGDVTVLFRKELALAASEVSHSVDEAKHGVQTMITGGAVLHAGVLLLLAAVTLWLATIMAAWLAALILGAIVTVIGRCHGQRGQETGKYPYPYARAHRRFATERQTGC